MKNNRNKTVLLKRSIHFVLVWLIGFSSAYAQQSSSKIVTGQVLGSDGSPLVGATVALKSTSSGTITDLEGRFSIAIAESIKDPVLTFSYLGFISTEVEVKNQTHINARLQEEPNSLEEVVVIGYGTVSRRDLTGSVDKVDMKEMQKAPVISFDQSLAGRVAGVNIFSNEGTPGVDADIVIRGTNSVTQDNNPLFVIDGFPVEGSLSSFIDPNDIESMEILKDASATAIYGVRGANGVVIITTKSGTAKRPTLTYDGFYGIQSISKTMDVLDGYEFVKLQGELYSLEIMNTRYFSDGQTLDSYRGTGVNFQDHLFELAPIQKHGVTLSAGSDNTKYTASLSYTGQDGVIINTGFNRLQGRITIDQDVRDWLKVGIKTSYSHQKRYGATPASDTYSHAMSYNLLFNTWTYRPVTGSSDVDLLDELYDPGVDSSSDYRINPIIAVQNELRDRIQTNLMANAYVDIKLPYDLKWRSTLGYNKWGMHDDQYNNSKSRTGNPRVGNLGVNAKETFEDRSRWTTEHTLSFKKRLKRVHNIDALAGATAQQQTLAYTSIWMQQIPNEQLGMSGMDDGAFNSLSAVRSENTLLSYLGRFNYNYNYKYYVTASFRADASSKFADGKKWGYFPSGSLMWRFNKEKFMQSASFISDGKLRLSWGLTGNNRIGDSPYQSQIITQPRYKYYWGGVPIISTVVGTPGNLDLGWEITSQTNLGLDLQLFKGRVSFTGDIYSKTTGDLLLFADLPGSSGFDTNKVYKNTGTVENKGLELTFNTVNIDANNFTWTTNFNISFNKNKVKALAENQEMLLTAVNWDSNWNNSPAYISRIGEPLGLMLGYWYEGTYKYEDFDRIGNSYLLKEGVPYIGDRSNVQPGDMRYSDINEDGIINDKDRTVIGKGFADHTGGFTNTFRYKDFDLSVFFQWSYGNDILNANKLVLERATRGYFNMFASYKDRWSPENPYSDIPRAGEGSGNHYSSYAIEDGSYIRLKSLTLGYNIPDNISKKIFMRDARIYFSAQNLFTLTNYSGMDPETSVRHSALTPGFDFSAYPRARTYSIGLNVSLR